MAIKSVLAGVPIGAGSPTRLMGVINVSPESFYKGSVQTRGQALAKMARRFTFEGTDFIDVGALSTAPYLDTQISEKEEAKRLDWAVRIIKKNTRVPISVDTSRYEPALAGLKAGATILNDIHGLRRDCRVASLAKKFRGVILMAHPDDRPEEHLENPPKEVGRILRSSLEIASRYKVASNRIAVDPGIGFFRKTKLPWWLWDLQILKELNRFRSLRVPLLIGLSRKSFIGHLCGGLPPEERLPGSLAAALLAVQLGAAMVRTHDVKATKEALQIADKILPQ